MTTFSLMSLALPSSGFNGKYGIFVSNTIPFGWKISAYIYHSTGLLVSHYVRSIGVPCSLYIDYRHNGELQVSNFHAVKQPPPPPPSASEFRLNAAKAAVFLAVYTLTCLGYTLGLKSVFFIRKSSNISVLPLTRIYRPFIYLLTSRRNFLSWLTRSFQVTLSLSTPFNVSQENVSRFVLQYRIHASLQMKSTLLLVGI